MDIRSNRFSCIVLNSKLMVSASLVFVFSLAVRILYFINLKEFRLYPDSMEYIRAAYKLSHFSIDTIRVPLYPVFIQVARHVLPWVELESAVFIFQMIISSAGMSMLFIISMLMFKSYIKAFVVSVTSLLSVSVLNWDFLILTESLSNFLMILLLFLSILFLNKPSSKLAAATFFVCGCLIFIRPFYIALPVLALFGFFVFRKVRAKLNKKLMTVAVLCFFTVYISVFTYSILNKVQNGYMGISPVGAVNKMGKILQYDMHELGDNGKIKQFIREEKEAAGRQDIEPVGFMARYGLDKENYKEADAFAGNIIKKHPLEYLKRTFNFVAGEKFLKYAVFTDYNRDNYIKAWPEKLFEVLENREAVNNFKFLFGLILVECVHTLISVIKRRAWGTGWLVVDSIILYQVAMSIAGSHAEYHRLVAPVYVLIFLIFYRNIFTIFDLIKNSTNRVSRI